MFIKRISLLARVTEPLAIFSLLIAFVTSAQADQPLESLGAGQVLTLSTAIEKALAKNPSLQVFPFRQDALQGQSDNAGLRPALELGLDLENVAGSGAYQSVDQAEATLSLSSTLELGGKRAARLALFDQGLAQLQIEKELAALQLVGDVTRRFVETLAAQERVRLALVAQSLAQEALQAVKKRAALGATPDVEIRRAEAAAAQNHLTLRSEQQQLAYLKVALAASWGESHVNFSSVTGDFYQFSAAITFENLYQQVAENPSIKLFASKQRLREAQLRLVKTQARSDVRWSVGVRRLQDSSDSALTAAISMPLFVAKRNRGNEYAANALLDEVSVQRDGALLAIRTQLYRAYSSREQAIHTADDLRKDIVPSLELALRDTRKAYEQGRYSYVDYVSARQELLGAQRSLIEAAAAAHSYGAEIEQLSAVSLPSSSNARIVATPSAASVIKNSKEH